MKVIHGLSECDPACRPSVLTIGNFDGVHRGHQAIIAKARELARGDGCPVVALTFEPHPIAVLRPEHAPPRLGTIDQKLSALAAARADVAVVVSSTPELLGIPAEEFLRGELVPRFAPRHIVEGVNFGFGRGRGGNVETLRDMASECGFEMDVVEPVRIELPDGSQERISSSLVRRLVAEGWVESAASALGRAYEVVGGVVAGDRRGRELGFPTANVDIADVLIPADAVYAGRVRVDGEDKPAAISVGTTPTFDGETRKVEVHLLDWSGDLYGKTLAVAFTHRVRAQRRFASRNELARQIDSDIQKVRELLR